jgi:hypothetical protein
MDADETESNCKNAYLLFGGWSGKDKSKRHRYICDIQFETDFYSSENVNYKVVDRILDMESSTVATDICIVRD